MSSKEMAYSNDLRGKVVSYVKSGHSRDSASKIFKLARGTVLSWLKMSETGDIKPKKRGPKQGKIREDRGKLLNFINNNTDKTLKELGEIFKVSHHSIWKILRKEFGYSYKKKHSYIKNVMMKKEKSIKIK